jgi:hypothetical protein
MEKNKFYSVKVRQHWVNLYFSGMSSREISKYYFEKFPEIKTPNHSVILKTIQKFQKFGSVENLKPSGRPVTVTNEINSTLLLTKIEVIY